MTAPDRPRRGPARPGRAVPALGLLVVLSLLLAACATPPTPSSAPPGTAAESAPESTADRGTFDGAARILGRNDRLLIYRPATGESLASIAQQLLGRADLAWQIAEANGGDGVEPGQPLIVPLRPLNPIGIEPDRVQTVPILCYHRFGPANSKMTVSPARFASQLDWLTRNGYRVIRLSALTAFLAGQQPLPRKSVVITIDDGYESVHRHAFPLLRQHGFPATLFVYTDFIGAGDALRWPQLQEMLSSGLIDVQSHSKTHRNLVDRLPGETDERYRINLGAELTAPRDVLRRRLEGAQVKHLAYPFGDANATVVGAAQREGYELGLTVVPGANAFYAQPMLLRRTMIFGDLDIEGFKAKLQTSRGFQVP